MSEIQVAVRVRRIGVDAGKGEPGAQTYHQVTVQQACRQFAMTCFEAQTRIGLRPTHQCVGATIWKKSEVIYTVTRRNMEVKRGIHDG